MLSILYPPRQQADGSGREPAGCELRGDVGHAALRDAAVGDWLYDLSTDGQRFFIVSAVDDESAAGITVTVNGSAAPK